MSINVETQKRNVYNFRFGQDFDFEKATYMWRRNAYANYWVSGIIDEIFLKGFKLVKPNTEEQYKWNPKMWETLKPMWVDILMGIKHQRANGKSLLTIMEDSTDTEELLLRSFHIKQYQVEYTKSFAIKTINATEHVQGSNATTIDHSWGEKDDKSGLYELIISDIFKKGTGISELEKIWDILFGLMTLEEHATLYAIRNGGGLPVAKIPMSLLADEEFMVAFNSGMQKFGAINTINIIPTADDDTFKGVEFDVIQSDQMDFLAIRDLLLGALAAATGIPREVWLGSELGLKSAETNRDSFYTLKQNIQAMYEKLFEWIIRKLNEHYKWFGEKTQFDFLFAVDQVKDEVTEMNVLKVKIEIVNAAGYNIDEKELSSMLGLKLIKKEIPAPLKEAIGEKVTDKDVVAPSSTDDEEETSAEDEQKLINAKIL